ncbi:tripartite tricarboxylate transporter permease [bacterium]|nr:MAG: tripartite tricarboxylate transporter permease [bacterium]
MEIFQNLQIGFSVALTPENLWFCFIGVFTGTLIGVLPGIGPVGAMALLLPTTFHLPPVGAIIMLAGIYYGAMYGGSTTSILLNIPGEAASVVTCIDGYQMARQGRAGPALGMSAIGSFIGGTASIIGLMLLAPPLSEVALKFGPPEYFSLMVLGLTLPSYMASGSIPKALMMAVMGVILGVAGIDATSGAQRFTFGILELNDGFDLIPLVMGLFGVSEVLLSVEDNVKREIFQTKIKDLLPTREDWKRSLAPIFRGSVLGFFLGILPGGGALISSFASYAMEKKLSKNPELFGKGAIEGVAGPETANNAATGGAFIPLLTLGIPSNVVMAVLLGALMIYGMEPGPMLLKNHPQLFWGAVTSMYIGNAMLLVLNLPLIGIWVQLLKVPYRILFPLILLFCLIGVYSLNYSAFEVQLMIIFGVLGYLMKKFRYEAAPLVLAYVLGPMVEISLRQSLTISNGSFGIFFTRPISVIGITAAILIIISPMLPWIKEKRRRLPLKEE